MAPPAGVAEDCGEDDEEQDAHPEDRDEEAAAVVAVALLAHHLLRALFGGFERELHLLADRIGARDDPARHVAVAESGQDGLVDDDARSEEHTSELQSLMRISYAVFCLKKKKTHTHKRNTGTIKLHHQNTQHTHELYT